MYSKISTFFFFFFGKRDENWKKQLEEIEIDIVWKREEKSSVKTRIVGF